MPLKHEKPNDRLMDQLIDVRNAVGEVEGALQKTNSLPYDFERAPLTDLLSALKILPAGTSAGARVTLRAAKVELQDFEDRHFLTQSESEREAQNNENTDKLSKHSNLGKEFRLLKSACDSALAECRRQAGTSPDEEEPPEDEIRQIGDPSDEVKENADIISKAMRQAHEQLNDAEISDSPEKEIVSRIITDTEHLSLTTKAVAALKTKSIWVGQQLQKAWKATPKLVEKSMSGLVAVIDASQYGHNKISKIQTELSDVLHNNGREIAQDIQNWAKNKQVSNNVENQPLPPIPDIDPEVQKIAEGKAVELLKAGKPIPPEIGLNVRILGSFSKQINVPRFSLMAECPYLLGAYFNGSEAFDLTPLAKHKYLKRLNLKNTQVTELAPLSQLTGLETLYLDNTPVKDLAPLSQLTELKALHLDSTQVIELAPLSQLTRLETLYLDSTQVTDLAPLSQLTELKFLHLDSTQVVELVPLSQLTELRTLYLDSTPVTEIAPLRQLTELKSLDLGNTQVTKFAPLGQLNGLRTLYLDNTQITELAPLRQLNGLKTLYLNDTQITDLAPLSQLDGLRTLILNDTQVTDLAPLSELTNLQEVEAINLNIKDWTPLKHVKSVYGRPD